MYKTLISAATLSRHLDSPAWVVIDCRFRLNDPQAGRMMYDESHIPGALYADLDRDLSKPPVTAEEGRHPLPDLSIIQAKLGNWGIGNGVQVICYDDFGGVLASRFWWMLRYLGHSTVAVLDGGWQSWLAHKFPTSSEHESSWPTTFEVALQPQMLASLAEVQQMSAGGDGWRLIDARDADRYRGEREPMDPVAGHIPGARNRPYAKNLTSIRTMRDTDELRQEWDAFLGDTSPSDTVMYCGSGVSACHNLLAMEHVGFGGTRLFIPSWSGWSADTTRPIEIG